MIVLSVGKKFLREWKKIYQKILLVYWRQDLQNGEQNYFLKYRLLSRYLTFGDFKVPHKKIGNKRQTTKNQENFAYRFQENYLTNHLPKFLQP